MTESKITRTTTISVSARELCRHLAAVLPHAGRDDDLPMINGISVQVLDGVLYLAATDRYTLAVTRLQIPGAAAEPVPDESVLLPRKAAKALMRLVRDLDGTVALGVAGGRLSAYAEDGTTSTWPLRKGEFVNWQKLLHKMLAAEQVPLGEDCGVDPAKLARFAGVQEPLAWESLSIRITSDVTFTGRTGDKEAKPAPVVLVTRGDWLVGALMPVRRSGSSVAEAAEAWARWTAMTAPAPTPEAAEPELAGVPGA